MTDRLEQREIFNFANVPIEELERDIKSTGFYRNKAKNIQAAAKMILEKFGGKLPQTMAQMLTIPGVARKTPTWCWGTLTEWSRESRSIPMF